MARLHTTSVAPLQGPYQPFITCLSKYPSEDFRGQLRMVPTGQSMGWLVLGLALGGGCGRPAVCVGAQTPAGVCALEATRHVLLPACLCQGPRVGSRAAEAARRGSYGESARR